MEVSINDYEGKKIVAELITNLGDERHDQIAITEMFGAAQIILEPGIAQRLGSILEMLARTAIREELERQKRDADA